MGVTRGIQSDFKKRLSGENNTILKAYNTAAGFLREWRQAVKGMGLITRIAAAATQLNNSVWMEEPRHI